MFDLQDGAGAGVALDTGAGAGGGGGEGTGGEGTGGGGGEGAGGEGAGPGEGGAEGAGEGEGGPGEGEAAGEGEGELGEIEPEGVETDGRKMDAATRQAIADLKKTNPAAAKRVAETYFRMGAVMKDVGAATPTEAVNKVREAMATIESLGGDEGITSLQSEVEDYRNEIKQFAAGDPELLVQLHQENADAFVNMAGQALAMVAQRSPDALDKALLPTMVARLDKAGMYSTLDRVIGHIKEGQGQEAYDLAVQIKRWLDQAKGMADKQVQLKDQKDPVKEENDRRALELDQREKQQFEGAVGADVNRQNNRVTARLVDPFFKELKLGTEGRREFVNALNSRVWAAMKKDGNFQRAAKAILAKGDQERASRFVHAKFAELLPTHFRSLRDVLYPNYSRGGTRASATAGKKAAAANGNANGANAAAAGGAKYTGGRPSREQVDWDRTSETMWITGRVYLKGKPDMVRFSWKDVQ
jgi:hypothetical protein